MKRAIGAFFAGTSVATLLMELLNRLLPETEGVGEVEVTHSRIVAGATQVGTIASGATLLMNQRCRRFTIQWFGFGLFGYIVGQLRAACAVAPSDYPYGLTDDSHRIESWGRIGAIWAATSYPGIAAMRWVGRRLRRRWRRFLRPRRRAPAT